MKLDRLEVGAPICASGKRPFSTQERAESELRAARSVRAANGSGYRPGCVEARVYQCPACGWSHLTSKKTKKKGWR